MHGMEHFDKMQGTMYNLGLSDANLSKMELCAAIQKQVKGFYVTEATIGEDPDKRDYIVSNEKIEKTGYKPDVSLDLGITELLKAFRIIKRNQYSNV